MVICFRATKISEKLQENWSLKLLIEKIIIPANYESQNRCDETFFNIDQSENEYTRKYSAPKEDEYTRKYSALKAGDTKDFYKNDAEARKNESSQSR